MNIMGLQIDMTDGMLALLIVVALVALGLLIHEDTESRKHVYLCDDGWDI